MVKIVNDNGFHEISIDDLTHDEVKEDVRNVLVDVENILQRLKNDNSDDSFHFHADLTLNAVKGEIETFLKYN